MLQVSVYTSDLGVLTAPTSHPAPSQEGPNPARNQEAGPLPRTQKDSSHHLPNLPALEDTARAMPLRETSADHLNPQYVLLGPRLPYGLHHPLGISDTPLPR